VVDRLEALRALRVVDPADVGEQFEIERRVVLEMPRQRRQHGPVDAKCLQVKAFDRRHPCAFGKGAADGGESVFARPHSDLRHLPAAARRAATLRW
jgi:hypothetical protein